MSGALGSLKLLGAGMILLGSVGAGLRLCAERRGQILLLRDLAEAMSLLQGELELRAAPMRELLLLPAGLRGDTGVFFRNLLSALDRLGEESFAEIWARELTRCFPCLTRFLLDELRSLGSVLGRMDREAELRALSACRAVLEDGARREQSLYPAQRRLLLGLSVSSGFLSIILLC